MSVEIRQSFLPFFQRVVLNDPEEWRGHSKLPESLGRKRVLPAFHPQGSVQTTVTAASSSRLSVTIAA